MNKYIQKNIQKKYKKRDITFHYTSLEMVKECLSITPIFGSVLDAGSGKNKIWYNNLKGKKYECEIEDGNDFYRWTKKVDWVIGNPPFSDGAGFLLHASKIAKKGIAFLGNINFVSSLTVKRFQILQEAGFTLSHIHITSDPRWYGRYYWLIFSKGQNNFISWRAK
jgi:hypothetical protein